MTAQNLTTVGESVKSESGVSLSQTVETPRDPQALLRDWDTLWSSYKRGQVPYRAVTSWCASLTDAQGEALWELLQGRAAMDEVLA